MVDLNRSLSLVLEDEEMRTHMERCAHAFEGYRERLPAIPYAYSRTLLVGRPHFELVIMQWSPGSVSPIHDHGDSRCWVLMMAGELEVQNFERTCAIGVSPVSLRDTGSLTLKVGDVDHRLTPLELHRVRNTGSVPAYSLQLYAQPITNYSIVDAHTGESRVVTATHDMFIELD